MAKIADLNTALKVIKTLRTEIASLQEQLEAAKTRRAGLTNKDVSDKYTEMSGEELRALVEKRGGNFTEIVAGFHSRARSIKARQWLRENPGSKKEVTAKTQVAPKKTQKVQGKVSTKKPAPAPAKAPAKKPRRNPLD